MTSSWFFLSTLNYDARSTTHQIHLVVCLTTDPKRVHHTVQSRASSFKWDYPLLPLRSYGSFLRLLPRLPFTSIPTFYLSLSNLLQKAVATQNVANSVTLQFTYFMKPLQSQKYGTILFFLLLFHVMNFL